MEKTYDKIRISYEQHADTGLLCAFSDDLKGLIVFGRTLSQLYEKLPAACADLVEAMSGDPVNYRWAGNDDSRSRGFNEPKADLGELIPG